MQVPLISGERVPRRLPLAARAEIGDSQHLAAQPRYEDRISAEAFGEEENRLTAQIDALRREDAEAEAEAQRQDELAVRFEEVGELLRQIDVEAVWDAGTVPSAGYWWRN